MKRRLKKYIPNEFKQSVFEIEFLVLYEKGFKLVFLDIDNTLIKYTTNYATNEVKELIKEIETIGFEIIFISNNYYKRVFEFTKEFKFPFVHYALKPLKLGFKRGLRKTSKKYKKGEILLVGDQLMTDIKGANKMGFYSVLVNPIEKKTDVWTTKINRFFERRIIKKVKIKHPEIYERSLKEYENL